MLTSLAKRDLQPELMDDPQLDPEEHRKALAGLARINAIGGTGLWQPIAQFARSKNRPIRILDVACGSGDVLVQIGKRARRANLALDLSGCDLSPVAIGAARARSEKAGLSVSFHVGDVFQGPLRGTYDIVMSSLFLHHLDENHALKLLQFMRQATSGLVLISDLSRSRFNAILVWIACHLFTSSRVVHYDGPASVRAAFTPNEVMTLAEKAGLNGAIIKSHFPARLILTWNSQ